MNFCKYKNYDGKECGRPAILNPEFCEMHERRKCSACKVNTATHDSFGDGPIGHAWILCDNPKCKEEYDKHVNR